MSNRNRKLWSLLFALTMLLQTLQVFYPHGHAHAEAEHELIRGTFHYAGKYNQHKDAELDYVYSDAYFEGDAHVYNPSLSTMSLALEMSSWSSLDEEEWTNKSANARDLLTGIGFSDYAQNDFWNDTPTIESIGVVAAHKHLEDATLIALAVRGGGYFSEWGSNVLVGAADEHVGFATARDNTLTFLNHYIADCGITGRVKLWLVGFSRGGAVANMAAGYLNDHGLTAEASLVPADLYCYTFEAPQGVMEDYARADVDYSNIHNIINPNDIVPLVAPDSWGFSRYNQTSHLLPSITTTHYAQVREQMLKHYASILEGVEGIDPDKAAYNIAEYAKTLEMKINWLSFLPGGNPFIEIRTVDNTHLPQSMMLVESVAALVDATKSRDHFHADIEADISTLLGELLGENKGTNLSDYIQTLGAVLTENNYANLIHVLEPIVQLNFKPFDVRMEEVAGRLKTVIPQPEGYTDIVGTVGSLAEVIATMLIDDPQAVLNLVLSLSNTNLIQAHYAEVTMAWLRAEDPNYTDTPFTASVPEALRVVRVNCPVNLMVYDKDGRLVASIINGVAASLVEGIGCAINPDGEMVLYLPSDASFDVQIVAYDDGSVNCSINEFNVVRSKYTYVVNYDDVPISNGDVLTAGIPQLSEDDLIDPSASGSDVDYPLLGNNGDSLKPDSILRGDQVNMYTVQAERNNEFGQVMGGGSYVENSFAQLTAYPVSGGSFIGWFKDGAQISADTTYRFPVTEDVTIVAHFGEAASYQVRFSAGEGGTVHNASAAYPAGSVLFLSATPNEGYMFDGWSASAGEIHNAGETSASLSVPECDVYVAAAFTPIGSICPSCQQALPEGKTHQAPCDRIGHYTCMPGYTPYVHRLCPICGNGYDCQAGHGYQSGECGVYMCAGCGVEILKTEDHTAPCSRHYVCEDDYTAEAHEMCTICGSGYVCDGTHGADEGQCGYVEPTPTPTPEPTPTPTPEPTPTPTPEPTPTPTPEPTPTPTPEPTPTPTPEPTPTPTPEPTPTPTPEPTPTPTPEPTPTPTPEPTPTPTPEPTPTPTPEPTPTPTPEPTPTPTPEPTPTPTPEPTPTPTPEPTPTPTPEPTPTPTPEPTPTPTPEPTPTPTPEPTPTPTPEPTPTPTPEPTPTPTPEPTPTPTLEPTPTPTPEPTPTPTPEPTPTPTPEPTPTPTPEPTPTPTPEPTPAPSDSWTNCDACGDPLANGETHLTACGNHYTCNSEHAALNHAECPSCGGDLCDGAMHDICEICSRPLCNGMEHGMNYGQCGNLNTSALVTCLKCGESTPSHSLHLGDCNVHYVCEVGGSLEDHMKCTLDGHGCECDSDGMNHSYCELCWNRWCDISQHQSCTLCGELVCGGLTEHEICEICHERMCTGEHGYGEGQCGYEGAVSALAAAARSVPPQQGFAAELLLFLPILARKKRR